jgi:hypothetical protein
MINDLTVAPDGTPGRLIGANTDSAVCGDAPRLPSPIAGPYGRLLV